MNRQIVAIKITRKALKGDCFLSQIKSRRDPSFLILRQTDYASLTNKELHNGLQKRPFLFICQEHEQWVGKQHYPQVYRPEMVYRKKGTKLAQHGGLCFLA